MGKSASEHAVDDQPLFRVESIPPPDGEDVHDCETKIGDWALELDEKRRASTAGQATAKVNAFDLAAVLEKAKRRSIAPPAPTFAPPTSAPPTSAISADAIAADGPPASCVLRAGAAATLAFGVGLAHVPEAPTSEDLDGFMVVEEVTIDVEEVRSSRALRSASRRKAGRSTGRLGRRFVDVFIVLAVIAAFAMTVSR